MNLKSLLKKTEKDEERIIRYADTIVLNSDYTGELDKSCLDLFKEIWEMDKPKKLSPPLLSVWQEVKRLQPQNNAGVTTNLDITTRYIQKNFDDVSTHLLIYGYIEKPDHTLKWVLNDNGKLMKELGGHKKYMAYKKGGIAATIGDQNSKRYYIPIFIALLGVLVSGGISLASYFLSKSNGIKAEQRLSKSDTLQERTMLRLQNLQSQVDSISKLLLSKPVDTTGIKH
jgi:hypothetical protein